MQKESEVNLKFIQDQIREFIEVIKEKGDDEKLCNTIIGAIVELLNTHNIHPREIITNSNTTLHQYAAFHKWISFLEKYPYQETIKDAEKTKLHLASTQETILNMIEDIRISSEDKLKLFIAILNEQDVNAKDIVDLKDTKGRTILGYATDTEQFLIVHFIKIITEQIEETVFLNQKELPNGFFDELLRLSGIRLPHYAASRGWKDFLESYFSNEENLPQLNEKDNSGRSVLKCAIDAGHSTTVGILMSLMEKAPSQEEFLDELKINPVEVTIKKVTIKNVVVTMSLLHVAAICGWNTFLENYFSKKENLKNIDLLDSPNGITPIECASGFGKADTVKLLIKLGAAFKESSFVSKAKNSFPIVLFRPRALHAAAERGQVEIVKLLLDNGASINGFDISEKTALYYAVINSHLEVIKILLQRKADVVAFMDNPPFSILYLGVMTNDSTIVHLLSENGAYFNRHSADFEYSDLLEAVIFKQEFSVEFILNYMRFNENEYDEDINELDREILKANRPWGFKIFNPYRQSIKNMVNDDKKRLLHYALDIPTHKKMSEDSQLIEKKTLSIIKSLIKAGADPELCDTNGMSALEYAFSIKSNMKFIKCLVNFRNNKYSLEGIRSIRHGKIMALLYAAKYNCETFFISFEFDYHVTNATIDLIEKSSGKSPLHYAVQAGNMKIASLLLTSGFNVHIYLPDKNGMSPIFYTVKRNDIEMLTLIEKHQFNPPKDAFLRVEKSSGMTTLHWAAKEGNTKIVNILLQMGFGICINLSDNQKTSPFAYAVQNGDDEMVNLMLSLKPIVSDNIPQLADNNPNLSAETKQAIEILYSAQVNAEWAKKFPTERFPHFSWDAEKKPLQLEDESLQETFSDPSLLNGL